MIKSTLLTTMTALLISCGADDSKRIPSVTFDSPGQSGEAADDSYTIQVSFEDVVLGDTWSLYAISDANETLEQAIVEDFSVTNRTITWETADIPAGTYSFYAELKSQDRILTATAPGNVNVSHPQNSSNTPPSIAVSAPNANSTVAIGTAFNVAFSGSDADGDTLSYEIELSSDEGNTWSTLATVSSSPYAWTPDAALTAGTHYQIRVKATDTVGSAESDTSQFFVLSSN